MSDTHSNTRNSQVDTIRSPARPRHRVALDGSVGPSRPASARPDHVSQASEADTSNANQLGAKAVTDLPPPGANEAQLKVEYLGAEDIKPAEDQFISHSPQQKAALVASIAQSGICGVIRIDMEGNILDGHLLFEILKEHGATKYPVIRLPLNSDQAAHLRIALNAIPGMAKINPQKFKAYLHKIKPATVRLKAYPESFGVSSVEYDRFMSSPIEHDMDENEPQLPEAAVTELGDLWILGDHAVYCGDALKPESYRTVVGSELARMVVADLPYNVPIQGHVSGLGTVEHREFVQASGELTEDQFVTFINKSMACNYAVLMEGGLAYYFMDWRSVDHVIRQGKLVFDEYKQLLIWNKGTGAMGSFYRSQHEMIPVFKKGTAPHINNFRLGETGRYRTNVLDYPGANSFGRTRQSDLEAHPTVKPTVMIADLILDVSYPGDVILDPFGGSGTTMLAAEKTGRRARLIELDPIYVDTSIRRFEEITGKQAVLHASGETFAVTALARLKAGVQVDV